MCCWHAHHAPQAPTFPASRALPDSNLLFAICRKDLDPHHVYLPEVTYRGHATHLLARCHVALHTACLKSGAAELIHAQGLVRILDHARPRQPLEVAGYVVRIYVHYTTPSTPPSSQQLWWNGTCLVVPFVSNSSRRHDTTDQTGNIVPGPTAERQHGRRITASEPHRRRIR